ncbi:MAG: hypothetical protein FWG10_04535 [Eubacteriaceae bacterium]|nr:hypothetical protein [Eubacteriaceae bacterium]
MKQRANTHEQRKAVARIIKDNGKLAQKESPEDCALPANLPVAGNAHLHKIAAKAGKQPG